MWARNVGDKDVAVKTGIMLVSIRYNVVERQSIEDEDQHSRVEVFDRILVLATILVVHL